MDHVEHGPDVEIDHLTLRFADRLALDDVTCTLPGGRISGLLGRNGAGKSSLLAVLAGFRRPTAGTIRVAGRGVYEVGATTRRVCLVRGAADGVPRDWAAERVEETLAAPGALRPRWDHAYAAALVERFRVPLRAKVDELSTGQRSAVAITVGLAARAPVTAFDEPHLSLDLPSRRAFYDEVARDLAVHPRTVIIATHLVGEAATLFDDVVVLDEGRIRFHGAPERLRADTLTVRGPVAAVGRFTERREVVAVHGAGGHAVAVVAGPPDDAERTAAAAAGLELVPTSLEDVVLGLATSEVSR